MGRRNWLFCDTHDGGRACGIFYSLIVTAKLNGADCNLYIQYLCESIPGGIDGPSHGLSREFLESMMPWSPEYRAYEAHMKQKTYDLVRLVSSEKPDPRAMRSQHAA